MNRICLFFLWLIAMTSRVFAADSATNHHVIVITIDGCAAYLFNDPRSPIPNLRRIAEDGVVAKGMKVSNPSVTWPNHTTIVTGVSPVKHSVLYNGLMRPDQKNELRREPDRDKEDLVAVPTVYDFLHGKGFTTAAINWPCTRKAKTLDDNFPDVPEVLRYSTPRLVKELVEGKILTSAKDATFTDKTSPKRDEVWTEVACHVLRVRQPNFMLFHLLLLDSTQHRYGPQSEEGYQALALIDQHIGRLFEELDKDGLRESTTVFITADHGFQKVTKHIVASVALRKAGLLETEDHSKKTRVQVISEGGTLMVYFRDAKTREEDRKKVIELFKNQEGIDRIIEPKDFAKYGYPQPGNNPQMADLVLSAKKDYGFSGLETGDESILPTRAGGSGSHGFPADNPNMNAIFIASGRDIKHGKKNRHGGEHRHRS
ncbi:MAG: ectonucleotide pyrophosphatase/phosphodiesterase, partial [Verrucomicrobiota bacterium]